MSQFFKIKGRVIPTFTVPATQPGEKVVRNGEWNGRRVHLIEANVQDRNSRLFVVQGNETSEPAMSVSLNAHDHAQCELAFTMTYGGQIVWHD